MVETTTNDFVTPVYEGLVSTTENLSTAIANFCNNPEEPTLAASQDRLAEAEAAWHRSATIRIGPTEWRRTTNAFSTMADGERIEGLIDNEEVAVLNAEYIGSRTATTQHGLGTVRYLLGEGPDGRPDLVGFVSAPRRCEYLAAASEAMMIEAAELNSEWTESWNDGEPYVHTLLTSDPEKTVDALVNDSIFVLEELHMTRLQSLLDGDPSTEFTGLAGDIAFQNRFESARQILVGPDGTSGISSLVSDELAQRLRDQTNQVHKAFAASPQPLDAAPFNSAAVETLRSTVEQLQITTSTEVASQLGITLAFSDADGDSG